MADTEHLTQIPAAAAEVARPLRFLFAVNAPWTETLGVSRVYIELGRQLARLGHRVDKFSLEDARPRIGGRIGGAIADAVFQRALLRHIRRVGWEYDVIQAEHNLLVFDRRAYRFDGCLIAKSVGLRHFYDRYQREVEPELLRRLGTTESRVGRLVRAAGRRFAYGMTGAAERSFRVADQIHLNNEDELAFVRDELGYGDKCVLVSNAVSDGRAAALAAAAEPVRRQASRVIAFVGTWSPRKGMLEMPAILRAVRERDPNAGLLLLGVRASPDAVRTAFAPQDRASVEVVETFEPDELPSLLAGVRVGVFPSYIEGLPLGTLEMMASGLPVVAWDVPGLRHLVSQACRDDLVPAGNATATAVRLADHLLCDPDTYSRRAAAALDASAGYRWDAAAASFLAAVMRSPLLHHASSDVQPISNNPGH